MKPSKQLRYLGMILFVLLAGATSCSGSGSDQDFFRGKTVIPVVSFSEARLASLPNVPTIFEVMPADKQKLIQGLIRIYALDRMMIAPPHLPARELKVLREALDQVVADPEFLQTMTTLKRPVEYLTGVQVTTLLESILSNEDQIKPLVLMVAQRSR